MYASYDGRGSVRNLFRFSLSKLSRGGDHECLVIVLKSFKMGITKQYLRYVSWKNFNIVYHPDCNVVFVTLNGISDRYVAIMTIENEDMKNNSLKKISVIKLATTSEGKYIAVGHSGSLVNTFNLATGKIIGTFQGHRSAITALTYDTHGHMLVSGSKDTEAVIWSVIAEKGLHRLSGHKGVVTGVQFMNKHNLVDLTTGHCFKTLAGHITEVFTFSILRDDDFVVAGSNDAELRTWKIIKMNEDESEIKTGSLMREGPGCVVDTDNTNHLLCVHGHGKLLELFIFNGGGEALECLRNRQQKFRKKASKRDGNNEDIAFLNEKNPALQDVVRRLPPILTDYKIRSADLVVNQTYVKISLHGHRSNVRVLSFSSNNLAIFTGGSECIKMWSRKTFNCIETVETYSGVQCLCVLPGDRHILAGLEDGKLLVINIAAGDIIESISAHQNDLKVKLWQLELVTVPSSDRKVLSLLHLKTLHPDNKLLAVVLLDNTVKIFFMDTFKHFINFYGHTLPVNDMDISYDSSIIIFASGDKTIRIWGLNYGDFHKHLPTESTLTNKNGNIKHWDADVFERVLTLQGHRGECRNMSVSGNGYYVTSCDQDIIILLYEKTEEPLVLEDEWEEERAQEDDKELATGEETNVYGGPSAELLLECLNVIKEYKDNLLESENKGVDKPTLPIIMTAFNVKTTDDYLFEIVKRIRSSELEEVLLLMPFSSVCYFMEALIPLLNHMHHGIKPVVWSLIFLVQTLHKPISSDLVGENLHLLMFINNSQEEEELVFNITQNVQKKRKRQKQKLLKSVFVNM
ncbi:hypothetical protein QTP88_000545 [Uroleucon formosanum]